MASTITKFSHLQRPLEEVLKATDNFANENIISRGGFGKAYKGQLLHSGKLVDISARRLDRRYGLGDVEFWTEISLLSDLKHKNIVSIIGFCDEKNEKIIISAYDSNGSLVKHLNNPNLTWMQRLEICVGVARGLSYLHHDEGRSYGVIHRNVSSYTILLDENWEAKLSGFEIALKQSASRMDQILPCEPIGTEGYMDPTIEKTGGVTYKSDIYSFGVVLFEILCGRTAYNPHDKSNRFLAPLAIFHCESNKLKDIIHPDLWKQMDMGSVSKFSRVAYSCLIKERAYCPDMDRVVIQLERSLELQLPRENRMKNLEQLRLAIQKKNLDHLKIPLNDIKLATDNFSNTYCIAYATDYRWYKAELDYFDKEKGKNKGELPNTHNRVIIKRFFARHDKEGEEMFFTEIDVLTTCKHRNIVTLLGYCDEGSELIVVIEHLFNGFLDEYLANNNHMLVLSWETRLRICLDVANGLRYLHNEMEGENKIIVRDMKSGYIALDEKWRAKIADFRLSVFLPPGQDDDAVHHKNYLGTIEYIDPEYKNTGKLKRESDVYSFGIVLFEIFFGRLACDQIYMKDIGKGLAAVARRCFLKGTLKEMIDPSMKEEIGENNSVPNRGPNEDSLDIYLKIAYECVAETQDQRPTMEAIINELEKALLIQERGHHQDMDQIDELEKALELQLTHGNLEEREQCSDMDQVAGKLEKPLEHRLTPENPGKSINSGEGTSHDNWKTLLIQEECGNHQYMDQVDELEKALELQLTHGNLEEKEQCSDMDQGAGKLKKPLEHRLTLENPGKSINAGEGTSHDNWKTLLIQEECGHHQYTDQVDELEKAFELQLTHGNLEGQEQCSDMGQVVDRLKKPLEQQLTHENPRTSINTVKGTSHDNRKTLLIQVNEECGHHQDIHHDDELEKELELQLMHGNLEEQEQYSYMGHVVDRLKKPLEQHFTLENPGKSINAGEWRSHDNRKELLIQECGHHQDIHQDDELEKELELQLTHGNLEEQEQCSDMGQVVDKLKKPLEQHFTLENPGKSINAGEWRSHDNWKELLIQEECGHHQDSHQDDELEKELELQLTHGNLEEQEQCSDMGQVVDKLKKPMEQHFTLENPSINAGEWRSQDNRKELLIQEECGHHQYIDQVDELEKALELHLAHENLGKLINIGEGTSQDNRKALLIQECGHHQDIHDDDELEEELELQLTHGNLEEQEQCSDMGEVVDKLKKPLEQQLALENPGKSINAGEGTSRDNLKALLIQGKNLEHFKKIPLNDLKSVTENFSDTFCILSGKFYNCYRAKLHHFDKQNTNSIEEENKGELSLSTDYNVVITRIFPREDKLDEHFFFREIETLSACKHSNIVTLLGFCDDNSEFILVIEHLPNTFLGRFLRDTNDMPVTLTWGKRLKICLDVANGLNYLHYEMDDQKIIINRGIQSNSIALDENWRAKIADFKYSIFLPPNLDDGALHTNVIFGTRQYMDPEYAMTGNLKRESDVYSFGVVMFEILCGRRASDRIYLKESVMGLADVARRLFIEGRIIEIIDPIIKEEIGENNFITKRGPNEESLYTFINIAYQCVALTQEQRPTMKVVIKELEKALIFQENNKDYLRISLEKIRLATKNFDPQNCIGGGGFGKVFIGKVPKDDGFNTIVAKRLDTRGGQGEQQFLSELQILFEYKHDNIICLLGYCDENDDKIIVYEYESRGSLDRYLEDNRLTWMKRLKICVDVASALDFLHRGAGTQARVIHRDIKTANILLNDDWKAKLADFGLSLISPINQETDYVIDHACGTPGYLDPLYRKSGFLTIESDIYSFGVVLFEILCGRSTYKVLKDEGRFLQNFIKCMFEEGKHDEVVFEGIREQIKPKSLATFQRIAYQCLEDDREKRPTAKEVVAQLRMALEFQEDR